MALADLTSDERLALLSVGVDPDARPSAAAKAPEAIALNQLPGAWLPIISHARDNLDLRLIAGFFRTPQPDLENDWGDALTPLEWLADGRDPEAVIALIRDL